MVATITELKRVHQVDVEISKPLMRDGDGLQQQVGVAMDLSLLAVRQYFAQLAMPLARLRQTNLLDTNAERLVSQGGEQCSGSCWICIHFGGESGIWIWILDTDSGSRCLKSQNLL
jgi:hypothetical protein